MKRIRKIIFNAMTVLSLLLCVGTIVLWIRSYTIFEQWRFALRPVEENFTSHGFNFYEERWIGSEMGQLRLHEEYKFTTTISSDDEISPASYRRTSVVRPIYRSHDDQRIQKYWRIPGLEFFGYPTQSFPFPNAVQGWSASSVGSVGKRTDLGVSWWLFASLFGILPTVYGRMMWISSRRQKREAANLCCGCGYDLRATPDRCPECGTVPSGANA